MTKHQPTQEMHDAISHALSGRPFKIGAGAGTGKTSTLTSIAEAKDEQARASNRRPDKGLYITFSSAVAKEAERRMPSSVKPRTAHSLAYAVYGRAFGDRLKQRLNARAIADHFKINRPFFYGNNEVEISRTVMANMALDTIICFCHTADLFITSAHIPWSFIPTSNMETRSRIAEHVLFYAEKLWDEMSDTEGFFPTNHDVYLKMWGLSRPKLKYDYILFDETQDASLVMLDIVMRQKHAQIVTVGDDDQSIYEWRGAVNAMNIVDFGLEAKLTQSFRFGGAIAHLANQVLMDFKGVNKQLKGFDKINSVITECHKPDAIIARTNGVLIRHLMEHLAMGSRVGLSGSVPQLMALVTGIGNLKAGQRTEIKELALFRTFNELQEYSETSSGGDIKSLLRQVDKHGVDTLLNAFSQVGEFGKKDTPQDFNVILTTAHRGKGLEFDRVKLADDFKWPKKPDYTDMDANLLYVAVTRAKKELDISECEAAIIASNYCLPEIIQNNEPIGAHKAIGYFPIEEIRTVIQSKRTEKPEEIAMAEKPEKKAVKKAVKKTSKSKLKEMPVSSALFDILADFDQAVFRSKLNS